MQHEILTRLKKSKKGMTTVDLAEELDMSSNSAPIQLNRLYEFGFVKKKAIRVKGTYRSHRWYING